VITDTGCDLLVLCENAMWVQVILKCSAVLFKQTPHLLRLVGHHLLEVGEELLAVSAVICVAHNCRHILTEHIYRHA